MHGLEDASIVLHHGEVGKDDGRLEKRAMGFSLRFFDSTKLCRNQTLR